MKYRTKVAQGFNQAQQDVDKIPIIGKAFGAIIGSINGFIGLEHKHPPPPPPPQAVFQPGV
jgi:hypothetical protein